MFATMKMGTKILAGFGLALAVLLAVGGVAWNGASNLSAALTDVAEAKMPSALALDAMQIDMFAAARNLNASMLRRNEGVVRRGALAAARQALDGIEEGAKAYEALPHGEEALRLWGDGGGRPLARARGPVGA